LISQPGQPFSKDELTDAIWPDRIVSDSSLTVCIREIREALGDDSRTPRYVQTMHRHGYRFIGRIATAGRAAHHAHFVGRHAELEVLRQAFEAAQHGERHLILVSGHAGVGKSSLIETWRASIEASTDAWIVIGRCMDQSGAGEAYLPFLDALRRMASGPDADEVIAQMRRIAPSWLLLFPALITEGDREALVAETRDTDAARMRRELADLLTALSARRPFVLIIEDMHWCDASSAAALSFLGRDASFGRLLVIASFRRADILDPKHALSKIRGELRVRNLCTELELGALTEIEVGAYLAGRLKGRCSQDLAGAIYRRTKGHPLFMSTLVDQLKSDVGGLSPEALLDSTVPSDLATFIELRLADLDLNEREVLEMASVVGEIFSTAEINAAIEQDADHPSVDRLCERIARRGELLDDADPTRWPDGTLTDCYRFRHTLYAEVIRGTIGKARRARLHQRIGERLERGYEGETPIIAAKLAHHFEQAHDIPRAVAYLIEAANRDLARHAHSEAAALLRRGLDLVGGIDNEEERALLEMNLLLALGPVQVAQEGYGASTVEATFARAYKLFASEALDDHRFPVLRGLAAFHHLRADFATAHQLGAELIALGESADPVDDDHLVEGHLICGFVDFFRGRLIGSDSALERSMAHYDQNRHAAHAQLHGIDPGTLALSFRALTSWMLGDPHHALVHATSALKLAEAVDHPFSLCQSHAVIALLHQFRGDFQLTRHHSDQASEIAIRLGFPYLVASERARRGWLCVQSGNPSEGIDDIREGIALYRDTGAVGGLTIIMSTLVEAYLLAGDLDCGLEAADEALSLARGNDEGVYEAELLRLQSELLRRSDNEADPAQTEQRLKAALALARRQRARPLEVRTSLHLASLWLQQDRRQETMEILAPIKEEISQYAPSGAMGNLMTMLGQSMCERRDINHVGQEPKLT